MGGAGGLGPQSPGSPWLCFLSDPANADPTSAGKDVRRGVLLKKGL